MLFKQVAFAAFFMVSAASASHLHERHTDDLFERDGGYGDHGGKGGWDGKKGPGSYMFAPTTQTATGDTCAAAFGDGYQTCREAAGNQNRLCYNPDAGQQCCNKSWSCPNGSFCMSDGSCCPKGMDEASCGAKKEEEKTSSTVASSTTSSIWSAKSSATYVSSMSHNATSSKTTYPTTLANVTSSKPLLSSAASTPTGATVPAQGNGAGHATLSAAGVVGAGLLALFATL